MNGIISEIQHASVHDGPGLRSVVFLKGCQMHCFWCHNPETISASPQLFFDESKCMGCGRCLGVCEAHKLSNGRHRIERTFCTSCFRCVETCFTGALSVCGRVVSVDEVMRDLAEDIPFYGESGGGVTVSGGEPGCQSDFTAEILHRCHKMKIHAALETNLAYSRAILEKLVAGCDLVMADLKHIDSQKHRAGTGHGNEQVLENLRSLTVPLILRTPIVPGFNDDAGTIRRIAEFAVKLDTLQYYELLTYHPLGCGKAERLGMEERAKPQTSPTINTTDYLIKAASETGVPLFLNGRRIVK